MTQPNVLITELDGALGILPPGSGNLHACLGVSSSGPLDTPAAYARIKDIQTDFGAGPNVEAAAHYIERYGKPVLITRTGQTTAASVTAVTSVATGTSVVTITASPTPNDDYEFKLLFVTGGTRGTAGATYKLSLDGGRNYGAETALGTATSITIPEAGGVSFALGAGTFVAGDYHTARATAPAPNATELGTAMDALANVLQPWELVQVTVPLTATLFDTLDAKFPTMATKGKYRGWIGNTRVPNIGESESSYKTALDTIFSAKTTKYGSLYAGAIKLQSSTVGRTYKRPLSFAAAAREANGTEEINVADPNLGPLPGTSIRDSNGNADEHDESINPGLDDSRYAVARTIEGLQGVYINRPRLFYVDGSDFQLMPHRRVLNLAQVALRSYFIRRLNRPVLVSKVTGFILEEEALEIERGASSAMATLLLAKPKASDVSFTLSRTDNVLSTKTLTGQARVIPLAYPEFINLDVGFNNPALQVQPV